MQIAPFYYSQRNAHFNMSPTNLTLINGAVIEMLITQSTFPDEIIMWKDTEGIIHEFTKNEFIAFALAVSSYIKGIILS